MPRGGGDLEICFVAGFGIGNARLRLWRCWSLSIYVFTKREDVRQNNWYLF
jgi:hypothetical protein